MASLIEIICIIKTDRYNPHERIRSVGGKNADGTRWLISQEEAIRYIEKGIHRFFVRQAGRTVSVIVAVSHYGNKYLKTEADGEQPNNLLSLSSCPI